MFKYTGTILRHERWLEMQIEILLWNLEGFDESDQGIKAPPDFSSPQRQGAASVDGGT